MKKIAMFTMGTRGDVQPYIYLSKGLMKAGYDVTLGTHPCWRGLVENLTLISKKRRALSAADQRML